jgi:hypothetical protein
VDEWTAEYRAEKNGAGICGAKPRLAIQALQPALRVAQKILPVNLRHRVVHFKPKDIFFPDPSKVVLELHGKEPIEGEVIDLSDSGAQKEAFAVIRVERITQPVLVPVSRLEVMPVT